MLSGRRLDLLEPSPLDIEIADIAHGLARVARWNGQTKGPHAFSVAQHSVLVERLVSELSPRLAREGRLMALLLLHRFSDPIRHICIEDWQQQADDLVQLQELIWPV